jgi:glucose-1-phosphate thymidylyltransferase
LNVNRMANDSLPDSHGTERRTDDVIGLVPAAGRAKRLAPLPCSKELYPIGFARKGENGEPRAKVVGEYLFDKFRNAHIHKAILIIRNGKWDIPAYFGDGQIVGMDLAYVVIAESCGPPDTIDRAYPFAAKKRIAFGFPDIMFGPEDVFDRLLRHQSASGCDAVLGLYPAHDTRQMDMIDLDDHGRVRDIVLKPKETDLKYAWICAVWTPTFTDFLHRFLRSETARGLLDTLADRKIDPQGDLPMGAVFQAAVQGGLGVEAVTFPDGTYIDIGIPENLVKSVERWRLA